MDGATCVGIGNGVAGVLVTTLNSRIGEKNPKTKVETGLPRAY